MTARNPERLAILLREKRDAVLAGRRSVFGETAEAAPTAFSFHVADHAGAAYDREVGARVLEEEDRLLFEIDAALKRISDGTYGVCDECGEPIPAARLEAKPWACHCVPCRSAWEKRANGHHAPAPNGKRRGRRK